MFKTAIDLINRLHNFGYEAYVVGGAVRDLVIGIHPDDIDIVTNASYDVMKSIFSNRSLVEVGKNFGILVVDGIEVATYRQDIYSGKKSRNDNVIFVKTLLEDTARRDFTINAMALDIDSNRIIDYHGGMEDLRDGKIKFVGNPMDRIWEDPNRMIRACRFVAKLNGYMNNQTTQAIIDSVEKEFHRISSERIHEEILKAMKIRKASRFFKELHRTGLLEKIFPSLNSCYNHPHGPHHIEPIFDHCLMAGDFINTHYPLQKLAAYLHDVGKPAAAHINPRTNDLKFTHHAEKGSDILKEELRKLTFSNDEIDYITALVRNHMRECLSGTPKSIRRLLRITQEEKFSYIDFVRVRCADRFGSLKASPYTFSDMRKMINKFIEQLSYTGPKNPLSDLAVDGHDVMNIRGIKPGPLVGKILKYLLLVVIDDPDKNNKEILSSIITHLNPCELDELIIKEDNYGEEE